MFLRSLVVRGFKSFADKTVLHFEPGVTIVVGPNGSGKSNVVDAISWVLGEQGARSLRGSKMEDVIFAGSRLRPALGMAEVSMTIDNSAGLLPIEFSEVTISRLLFRSGESEYRLNGAPCRLLDIQEVLSDTGIGREQHTIIGQGQLDAVLNADPAQMRGFIEEAAGVAKHRRRKDRSLRKIAATEQNILRISDLLAEIRRQLRPLREQADVAKRYSSLADELSRIRMVLTARELREAHRKLDAGGSIDMDEVIRAKEAELAEIEQGLTGAEHERNTVFAEMELRREASWQMARSGERLAAIVRLAQEREKTLSAELAATTEAAAQAKVSEIERQLDESRSLLQEAEQDVSRAATAVAAAFSAFTQASDRLAQQTDKLVPLRTDNRQAVSQAIQLRSEAAALSASVEAAEREKRKLEEKRDALGARRSEIEQQITSLREEVDEAEKKVMPLESVLSAAEQSLIEAEERASAITAEARSLEREVAAWRARSEVKSPGASSAASERIAASTPGVIGPLSSLVGATDDHRLLGFVFGDLDSLFLARDEEAAVAFLAATAEGGASVIVGNKAMHVPGARPLLDGKEAPAEVVEALSFIFVASSEAEALRLSRAHPEAVFVTSDGAVSWGRWAGKAAADVRAKVLELEASLASFKQQEQSAREAVALAEVERERSASALNRADAEMAAVAESLNALERELHAIEREDSAMKDSSERGSDAVAALQARLSATTLRLPQIEAAIESSGSALEELQAIHGQLFAQKEHAATVLADAKLDERVAEERLRAVRQRIDDLANANQAASSAASGVEGRRAALMAMSERAAGIAQEATDLRVSAQGWVSEADELYRQSRDQVQQIEDNVSALRLERVGRAGALDDLRVRARQEDLGLSEMRIRSRILEERMRDEWGPEPDVLVSKWGHQWDIEDPSRLTDPTEKVAAQDQEALDKRMAKLTKDLEQMGRINPLAAQEFEALSQREEFLATQIADVRASRRDLMKIVHSVDERIRELFAEAFEDVAREYESLFAMLFPGGQGRLRLTEPNDLLETGVEVEARPGGKNLKRLSLLSGGERALSALAVLFAIFRARPSPFYVLDEVEAALDDVNLHRFISLLREFRTSSQLLVVTHQKRTMEAADVLYGVSIRPDGASRVISQKLNSEAPAVADIKGRVTSDS